MKGDTMNASIDIREADIQEADYAEVRPLLEIRDLAIGFATGNGEVQAVRANLQLSPSNSSSSRILYLLSRRLVISV